MSRCRRREPHVCGCTIAQSPTHVVPPLTSFYDRNEILMRRQAARRANEATSSAMLLESLINGRKLRLRNFLRIVKRSPGCRLAITSAESSKNADRCAALREFTLELLYSSTLLRWSLSSSSSSLALLPLAWRARVVNVARRIHSSPAGYSS
jgi:hypothetical protein